MSEWFLLPPEFQDILTLIWIDNNIGMTTQFTSGDKSKLSIHDEYEFTFSRNKRLCSHPNLMKKMGAVIEEYKQKHGTDCSAYIGFAFYGSDDRTCVYSFDECRKLGISIRELSLPSWCVDKVEKAFERYKNVVGAAKTSKPRDWRRHHRRKRND